MNRCLILLIFTLALFQQGWCQELIVAGSVTDASTGLPVPGVNIYAPSGRYGTISDEKGQYSLSIPRGRTHEILASCVGYETVKKEVPVTGHIQWNIKLEKAENVISDVEVLAAREVFGLHDVQMGAQRLSSEQIASIPSLFGETDVLKSIQKLPGVMAMADGRAGIMVRGGNYDQNYISLHGIPLYSTEHLKGFVSAINPDVTDVVDVYKGAFPARYGSKLSSVVDVTQKEGDMERYHGAATLGLLSSKIYAEGPLNKGKTSFLVAGRISYTNAFIQPLFEEIADDEKRVGTYLNMDYFDVNALLTHKFSPQDKLQLMFYLGRDWDKGAPSASVREDSYDSEGGSFLLNESRESATENHWGNLASMIRWSHQSSSKLSFLTGLGYTSFRSQMQMNSQSDLQIDRMDGIGERELFRREIIHSNIRYNSGIQEILGHSDMLWALNPQHSLRAGIKLSFQKLSPYVDSYMNYYLKELLDLDDGLGEDFYRERESLLDTRLGSEYQEWTTSVYAEDEWNPSRHLAVSAGLRAILYGVKGSTRVSIEPRLSMRYLLTDNLSAKLGYARMSQGVHLLSSGNLVMPSDLWVPFTPNLDLATSDQFSAGISRRVGKGLELSVEAYYKKMEGLLEYQEGATFMNKDADWEKMVSQGGGHSYGVEFLARKRTGRTTGWISYAYARSYRKFDRPGMEISGGKEFLASTDRPHTVNVVLTHQIGRHWDFSASWTFQSGRRGTLTTTAYYGGMLDEYQPYMRFSDVARYVGKLAYYELPQRYSINDESYAYFRRFVMVTSYKERNAYTLPATHHLDLGINYHIRHGKSESVLNLSVYNVYNRMNVSSVFVGFENNRLVLKGICMFPVLPSLSYTLKF